MSDFRALCSPRAVGSRHGLQGSHRLATRHPGDAAATRHRGVDVGRRVRAVRLVQPPSPGRPVRRPRDGYRPRRGLLPDGGQQHLPLRQAADAQPEHWSTNWRPVRFKASRRGSSSARTCCSWSSRTRRASGSRTPIATCWACTSATDPSAGRWPATSETLHAVGPRSGGRSSPKSRCSSRVRIA